MGIVQFFKDKRRIHMAGKAGKIETEIQMYNAMPIKTEEEWKHLARLNSQMSKIRESNQIKSERNSSTKISNNQVSLNFKGSQQVNAKQSNKQGKLSSKPRKSE